jgi:hypothetical protein
MSVSAPSIRRKRGQGCVLFQFEKTPKAFALIQFENTPKALFQFELVRTAEIVRRW